jgi:hypothetical protein
MPWIVLILLCSWNILLSQTIKQCKVRFDTYLNFRGSLNNAVKFEEGAIHIISKGEKQFSIYAHEIEMLADYFENTSYAQQEQLIKQKGTKKYSKRQRDSVWIYVDDRRKLPKGKKKLPLEGYRVAIDPGHFATNLKDAQIEQKFLYFTLDSSPHQTDTVKVFESELTFNTALLLRKMLEEQGASVMITRSQANFTSFDCTFSEWMFLHKKRVLDSLKVKDPQNAERYIRLLKADDHKFFWDFFRDFDLINRAQKINRYNPHATAIIHYNVDEKNIPWKKPTDKNFTMAFIGGSFTAENLERTETKLHFLRLLLTKQLNHSEKLASHTVLNFSKNLQVEIASQSDASYLKDNCLPATSKGVFARNLILCRIINSPLVYGEALYQDCNSECRELMKYDKEKFGINTNERLLKVANSYYQGLYDFLKSL